MWYAKRGLLVVFVPQSFTTHSLYFHFLSNSCSLRSINGAHGTLTPINSIRSYAINKLVYKGKITKKNCVIVQIVIWISVGVHFVHLQCWRQHRWKEKHTMLRTIIKTSQSFQKSWRTRWPWRRQWTQTYSFSRGLVVLCFVWFTLYYL